MQKTKLGVSVGLLGAAFFLFCLFGGYIAAILTAGYILLVEENGWLKKMAVRGLILMVAFSLVYLGLDIIPNLLTWVQSIVAIFGSGFNASVVYNIFNVIDGVVSAIETVVFVVLAVMSLNQRTIPIPGVDTLVAKHMD